MTRSMGGKVGRDEDAYVACNLRKLDTAMIHKCNRNDF